MKKCEKNVNVLEILIDQMFDLSSCNNEISLSRSGMYIHRYTNKHSCRQMNVKMHVNIDVFRANLTPSLNV